MTGRMSLDGDRMEGVKISGFTDFTARAEEGCWWKVMGK